MPPVVGAITAAAGAFTGAALGAGAAVGLSAGSSFAIMGVFQQLAAGVALSALSRALTPAPSQGGVSGTKVSLTFGEAQPASLILGRYCTAGDLVFHGSHNSNSGGAPNQFYTQVIELSDWPARAVRYWVNGEWVELRDTVGPDGYGSPVKGYSKGGRDFLWLKFYDGTQTTADPMLVAKYPPGSAYPWLPDMIGRGVPYVIVTARYDPDVHRGGKPEVRVELEAWGHYDPRKDSTAGGVGAQRWSDWRTWAPSENLAVHAYNIMRGIHDPITGDFVWGGQGVFAADLPASDWFAGMNECDRAIAKSGGGTDPQYHGGLEVRLGDEPASVVEEILKGCQGAIAECAGKWTLRVGAPGVPVYAFTDEDVIITSPDQLDPFPGLDAAYNGVSATYPEPANGWDAKPAPTRLSAAQLAEDGGRRRVADLRFPAVSNKRQVQRLMASALAEGRRFRRHTLVLPPEARKIGPLDEVSWTSARNGYPSKSWSVDMIEDLPNGCCALALRERDPDDYGWLPDDELPTVITPPVRPPRVVEPGNFSVEPATVSRGDGTPAAPAIRLKWVLTPGVDAIRYRVRLASTGAAVALAGQASDSERSESTLGLKLNGAQVTLNGDPVSFVTFENEEALELYISGRGILPNTAYLVDAIFAPTEGRAWQRDMAVTTPDVRLEERDLADTIRDKIEEARADAANAAADVAAVNARVDDIDDRVSAISDETLDRLDDLVAALGSFDLAALEQLTGIGRAGLMRGGWAKDPTFLDWTSGALVSWTSTGFATYASRDVSGAYGSSLALDIPAGSSAISATAASNVSGQMIAGDPKALYVTIGVELRCQSGSVSGSQIRVEWFNGTAWVRGHAFGQENSEGDFSAWGFSADADRTQSWQAVWKRPIEAAQAVRLVLVARKPGSTAAVKLRVDYLNVATTSEADIRAFLANGYADAQIENLRQAIVGPTGAIVSAQQTLRAEFGAADAAIASSLVAVASANEALAGRVDTMDVSFGGQNIVRNPVFADGARAAGVAPAYWANWPSGFSVIARSPASGDSAIANAPTAFIARVAPDGLTYASSAVVAYPVTKGDIVQARMKAAGAGTGISFIFQVRISWRNQAGTIIETTTSSWPITGVLWVDLDFGEFTAPEGASTLQMDVRRLSGGSANSGFFTGVELNRVDTRSRALITDAAAVAASASSSVATWRTKVEAEFDDYDTFLSLTGTAIASAEGAASAWVVRNIGGSFGFYGWDDKTGVGAALRVDAANVLLPGTVSAGELVITDQGFNLVPDNQLQSKTAWINVPTQFQLIPLTDNTAAGSQGEIRSVAGLDNIVCQSRTWPVRSGQILTCSGAYARFGGTTMSINVQIIFMDRAGDILTGGRVPIASYAGTNAGLQEFETQIEVPSGARQAAWRWGVISTDGRARFWAPSVVRRSRGSTVITPDAAFFEMLAAEEAWIGTANIIDANISTLKIKGDAVTVPVFATRTADYQCPNDAAWHDILSFNVPLAEDGKIVVNSVTSFSGAGTDGGSFINFASDWRIVIDGTVVFQTDVTALSGVVPMCGAKVCAKGSRAVQVQFKRVSSYAVPVSKWTSAWSIGAMR